MVFCVLLWATGNKTMDQKVFFRGVNHITVDTKGRMAIPSKYRQDLQDICHGALIVTAERDGALLIYPKPQWLKVEQRLHELPALDRDARKIQRLMIGHATECEVDANGRILLSAPLREHAAIQKLCLLLGQGNRFELWDQHRWSKYKESKIQEEINNEEVGEVLKTVNL